VIITNLDLIERNGLYLIYGDVESKYANNRGIVGIAKNVSDASLIESMLENYYDRVVIRKTRTRWKQDHWNIQEEDYKGWRKKK
jgi:hypothetical protein